MRRPLPQVVLGDQLSAIEPKGVTPAKVPGWERLSRGRADGKHRFEHKPPWHGRSTPAFLPGRNETIQEHVTVAKPLK